MSLEEYLLRAAAAAYWKVADVDLPAKRDFEERALRRSRRVARTLTLLAVLLVAGALVVVPGRGGGRGEGPTETLANGLPAPFERTPVPRTPSVPLPAGTSGAADVAAPDQPVSRQLPVDAWPANDLRSGDTVRVTSRSLTPNARVLVVLCTGRALTQGDDHCDASDPIWGQVTADGTFEAVVPVRRRIVTPAGRYDCAEGTVDPADYVARRDAGERPDVAGPQPWSCLVVVAETRDLTSSGGHPLRFDPAAG